MEKLEVIKSKKIIKFVPSYQQQAPHLHRKSIIITSVKDITISITDAANEYSKLFKYSLGPPGSHHSTKLIAF